MKSLHDQYEELIVENMKLRIHINDLVNARVDYIKESLQFELIITELELKIAKYELELSRKKV